MVGVGWPQALMMAHGPATVSRVPGWLSWLPGWVSWQQVFTTFLLALFASWVGLGIRYRHKGRPFGSPRAGVCAVAVILLTAGLATVMSEVLSHISPIPLGLLIPALLCADRVKEEPISDHPVWSWLITGGVSWLLDWLLGQTEDDRVKWATTKVDQEVHNLGDVSMAAEHVYTVISSRTRHRPGSRRLRHELKAFYDDVGIALDNARQAQNAGKLEDARLARYDAKKALIAMMELAYSWRCTRITVMPKHELV